MVTEEWRSFFKGKRVTQLGLGLLGRGINDAKFLVKHGVDLIVTDKKDELMLAPSIEKLGEWKEHIHFVLGGHKLDDFNNRDFILKAAGVPLDSPEIAEARKNGIPIEMDASLFAKLAPKGVIIVGVTGTRGKSTTAHLIFHILKTAKRRVFLGGNIKDTATLPLLEKVQPGDVVVLELDSWQLQGFGDSNISPHIAVFTTFMDDHLNYYKNDRDAYFADKANICKYQKSGDVFVVGEQAYERVIQEKRPAEVIVARASDVPILWKTKLVGEHNRANISCALAVARSLAIPDVVIKKALASFAGVPGRLEHVRTIRGVRIYNDTTATTPVATTVALRTLGSEKKKHIVLIVGGADKQLDFRELIAVIPQYCKAVIVLPGTGSEKLKIELSKLSLPVLHVGSMTEAVSVAFSKVCRGDCLLLSPGFASFGPPPGGFKNEYDRGEQFDKAIALLK
jgi:UDP-N-acetylmuramoylalanine--D-glutamate ligase